MVVVYLLEVSAVTCYNKNTFNFEAYNPGGAVLRLAPSGLAQYKPSEPFRRVEGQHFTKSFVAEEILFSEKHTDKSSALKREAQIKGWTRKKKLALIKGDLELLKRL